MTTEIRARMTKAAENREQINMFDTKDNASRLAQATQR
jgi:GST-like protein